MKPISTLTLPAQAPRLRTIVVPVGLAAHAAGASNAAVLQCAALLARTSGARIVLVHAFSVPQDWYRWEPATSEAEAVVRELHAKAEHRLVRVAQTLYYEGVPAEIAAVRCVDVVEGIIDTAEDVGADLIVMGTRGLATPQSGISVTERVVGRAPCSVVAVYQSEKPSPAPERLAPGSLRRLLLVTGVGDHIRSAVQLALALAAHHTAHLDVLVLAPTPSHAAGRTQRTTTEGQGPTRHEWQPERLAALLTPEEGDHAGGYDKECLVEADVFAASGAADVVEVAATRPPDLLVLAGVPDEPLGALADALAAQIPCTVLVHEPRP